MFLRPPLSGACGQETPQASTSGRGTQACPARHQHHHGPPSRRASPRQHRGQQRCSRRAWQPAQAACGTMQPWSIGGPHPDAAALAGARRRLAACRAAQRGQQGPGSDGRQGPGSGGPPQQPAPNGQAQRLRRLMQSLGIAGMPGLGMEVATKVVAAGNAAQQAGQGGGGPKAPPRPPPRQGDPPPNSPFAVPSTAATDAINEWGVGWGDDWDPEEELDEETMEQLAEEAEAQFRKRNTNKDGFRCAALRCCCLPLMCGGAATAHALVARERTHAPPPAHPHARTRMHSHPHPRAHTHAGTSGSRRCWTFRPWRAPWTRTRSARRTCCRARRWWVWRAACACGRARVRACA